MITTRDKHLPYVYVYLRVSLSSDIPHSRNNYYSYFIHTNQYLTHIPVLYSIARTSEITQVKIVLDIWGAQRNCGRFSGK